jgi:biotin transport system substrate-specific component
MILQHVSVKEMILASLFAALTSIGALLVIPFYPVPITCQTLFTYLSAMLLGKRIGVLSQIIYLVLGFIGLPVFAAGKAGPGVLLGPTGGYLWGFVLSAYTMGYLMEKKTIKRVNNYAVIGIVGLFIINFSGALQLYLVTKLNIQTIFLAGILPFLVGDIIKILAASFIAYKLKLTLNPRRMM